MSSLPVPAPRGARAAALPQPSLVVLVPTAPEIDELFEFMREAELRFRTLRMRIRDRSATAAGPQESTIELWLRHPGQAKVITTMPSSDRRQRYEVWLSDGTTVRKYDALHNLASIRPHRHVPEEIDDPDLPAHARVYTPLTELPMESLPEAFVHPHGFTRNVLATGIVALVGSAELAGREALVLEVQHPRTAQVSGDRPDRTLIVGVDRATGIVTLLEERVGDQVARRAEVTHLEPNAPIADDVFTLHIPADAATIF